jgi:hypothetical protein
MEFAPPPIEADATGAQAIGGMANMAGMLANKMLGGPKAGGAGAAMGGAMGSMMGQPTDSPMRRKTPMAMMPPNYA